MSVETRTYFDETFAYNKLDLNQSKVTINYLQRFTVCRSTIYLVRSAYLNWKNTQLKIVMAQVLVPSCGQDRWYKKAALFGAEGKRAYSSFATTPRENTLKPEYYHSQIS